MRISGLSKLTILDYPGKVACMIFTEGCNFKCPWCHNGGVVSGRWELLDEKSVLEFLEKRKGVLDGVVISGGEPLLQNDLIQFMVKVKNIGYSIKLDTNGFMTQKLKDIIDLGLVDYVAMDIKSAPESYSKVIGIDGFDAKNILESIELLEKSGVEHEFRTTCIKGLTTAGDIEAIAKTIPNAKHYFLQNFKDSGDLLGKGQFESFSENEMNDLILVAKKYNGNTALRGV